MKTIKFIISLAIVIIYMTSAAAQSFYYVGEKKIPLHLIPNVKVILCEDTITTSIHLEKGHLESACPTFWMPNILQARMIPAVKVGPLDEDNPGDNHYGYGLVNAYQTVINTPRPSKY